jgi:hypothetical protein
MPEAARKRLCVNKQNITNKQTPVLVSLPTPLRLPTHGRVTAASCGISSDAACCLPSTTIGCVTVEH